MISTRVHGMIDYPTGVFLLVAPFLFGFANDWIAQWLPMALGGMIIVMSLLTHYELSVAKLIPLPGHLGLDIVGGLLLAVSPWIFRFADMIWWPHLLVGLMIVAVAVLTKKHAPRPV